jgi:single-strand DNA-binding protein
MVLMGRLTRDPELRHTQTQTAVTSFTLAVDRGFTKSGGEKETDFIDCIAWKNQAEFVSKYFSKGQMAAVVGHLQIRDWTDKNGNKRRSAEVIAENVYFTGSKEPSDRGCNAPQFQAPGSDFAELEDDDGDLPF